MVNINEQKLFSQQSSDAQWLKALRSSSISDQDAKLRQATYGRVFSNYQAVKEAMKVFSGLTETPTIALQYFNATMASYVRSFAGFIAIERDMDQETAALNFMDLLGVTDNRRVLPNVGRENLRDINARFTTSSSFVEGTTEYRVATGKKILPGTVEIKFIDLDDVANPIIIKDDFRGNLIAAPGVLASGSVDYNASGKIEFETGSNFEPATGDTFIIVATEDVAGNPEFNQTAHGNNRFKLEQKYITLTAVSDLLIGESNLMSIATLNKSLGINPQEILGAKLTELYTKIVNASLVGSLQASYQGSTHAVPITTWLTTWYDYNSQLNAFIAELAAIDSDLAVKSVKGVQASAYVVGTEVGTWFQKCAGVGAFTKNLDSSYVNDLIGYINGVPVLQHVDVPAKVGYAIHKTKDGQLAPLMRGIYLPLTNTPAIGNYQNPTQFAQGVYYSEVNHAIVPELVQRFEIV